MILVKSEPEHLSWSLSFSQGHAEKILGSRNGKSIDNSFRYKIVVLGVIKTLLKQLIFSIIIIAREPQVN